MSGRCRVYGENNCTKVYKILNAETEGMRQFGRPSHRREDNIKSGFLEKEDLIVWIGFI
jgi:hypothetical protein